MTQRDYYDVLGVRTDAADADIKRAYRALALEYHPDRNPDKREWAEERFKEISEAYGVLMDPAKRLRYDGMRGRGFGREAFRRQGGFDPDDIFRDIFSNPHARDVFRDLHRQGVRFSDDFFRQTFFGGRGVFFGGAFSWTPFGRFRVRPFRAFYMGGPQFRPRHDGGAVAERVGPSPVGGLLKKLGRLLLGTGASDSHVGKRGGEADVHYTVRLSSEAVRSGEEIIIAYPRGKGRKKLKVKIPPGTTSGTKLRLRGQGQIPGKGEAPGDLYLEILVDDSAA